MVTDVENLDQLAGGLTGGSAGGLPAEHGRHGLRLEHGLRPAVVCGLVARGLEVLAADVCVLAGVPGRTSYCTQPILSLPSVHWDPFIEHNINSMTRNKYSSCFGEFSASSTLF